MWDCAGLVAIRDLPRVTTIRASARLCHHDRSDARSNVAMAGRWKPRLEILRAAPRVNRRAERRTWSLRVDCAEEIAETVPANRRHSAAGTSVSNGLPLIGCVS